MRSQTRLVTLSVAVFVLLFQVLSASVSSAAGAGVESPKACNQCGMDRTVFDRSRMLITYTDGGTSGVCSIHCAAADIKQNKDKQIKSLMVADYNSKELIGAMTATWVIGGNKQGVMTSVPKWAFAKSSEAKAFMKENGGRLAAFDEAMNAAKEEVGEDTTGSHQHHGHAGHDMGPTAQMLYNPGFGDDIYHTHPKGMWMATYKFMHMNMNGLRDGTSDVPQGDVGFKRGKPYNYMMIPTNMTMNMHMFMLMYGVTDRLTLMGMLNYQASDMNMLMDMGPGKMVSTEPPMKTSGLGDTEIRGIYKLNEKFVGSLGLSIPTGSTDEQFETMRMTFRSPYDMQLGSGTFDLKPAITYNDFSYDQKWNWGAQAMYTIHLGKNNDWSYGDSLKVTSWLQRAMGPLTTWVRLAYNNTAKIDGEDPEIRKLNHPAMGMGAPMPDADPNNYGGQRLDGLLGVSITKGPFSVGVEGGVPLYQDLNGLQLKTRWLLNIGVQVMF